MLSIFQFDAAGNSILVADARQTGCTAESILELLMQDLTRDRSLSAQDRSLFPVEMIAVLTGSATCAARVDFWNPDASRERVCGNALRCLPILFREQGDTADEFLVETRQGNFHVGLDPKNGLGNPHPLSRNPGNPGPGESAGQNSWAEFAPSHILSRQMKDNEWLVDCGTPHLVRNVDDIFETQWETYAEKYTHGAGCMNVTLWKWKNDSLHLRTFERSVGETGSCGTAAVAAFYIFRKTCDHPTQTQSAHPGLPDHAVQPNHALQPGHTLQPTSIRFGNEIRLAAGIMPSGAIRISGPCSITGKISLQSGPRREQSGSRREQTGSPGVSIVIAWRDRLELKGALPGLLDAAAEVGGDLTIVNYGGSDDLLRSQIGEFEEKVSVIEIKNVDYFNKPKAQNIGAALTTKEYLFFCDCDIILPPGTLRNLLDHVREVPGRFGTIAHVTETVLNSRKAKHVACFGYEMILKTIDGAVVRIVDNEEDAGSGTRQAPGLLFVSRLDFERIGGYNAQLDGWGWEDQDMICRLTLGGRLLRMQYGSVLHISHDDEARVQAFPYKDRWESRDRMFRRALSNYDEALFMGSYYENVHGIHLSQAAYV